MELTPLSAIIVSYVLLLLIFTTLVYKLKVLNIVYKMT